MAPTALVFLLFSLLHTDRTVDAYARISGMVSDTEPAQFLVSGVTFVELPLPCSPSSHFCPLDLCHVTTLTSGNAHCLDCMCPNGSALPNSLRPMVDENGEAFWPLPQPCTDNHRFCPIDNCHVSSADSGQGRCLLCKCQTIDVGPGPLGRRQMMGSHDYVVKGVTFYELPKPCSAQDRFCHVAGCVVNSTVMGGSICLQCHCDKDPVSALPPAAVVHGTAYFELPSPCDVTSAVCAVERCLVTSQRTDSGDPCLECTCTDHKNRCPLPPAVNGAMALYHDTKVGAEVTYVCEPPYVSQDGRGDIRARCLPDGSWEDPKLTCHVGPSVTPASHPPHLSSAWTSTPDLWTSSIAASQAWSAVPSDSWAVHASATPSLPVPIVSVHASSVLAPQSSVSVPVSGASSESVPQSSASVPVYGFTSEYAPHPQSSMYVPVYGASSESVYQSTAYVPMFSELVTPGFFPVSSNAVSASYVTMSSSQVLVPMSSAPVLMSSYVAPSVAVSMSSSRMVMSTDALFESSGIMPSPSMATPVSNYAESVSSRIMPSIDVAVSSINMPQPSTVLPSSSGPVPVQSMVASVSNNEVSMPGVATSPSASVQVDSSPAILPSTSAPSQPPSIYIDIHSLSPSPTAQNGGLSSSVTETPSSVLMFPGSSVTRVDGSASDVMSSAQQASLVPTVTISPTITDVTSGTESSSLGSSVAPSSSVVTVPVTTPTSTTTEAPAACVQCQGKQCQQSTSGSLCPDPSHVCFVKVTDERGERQVERGCLSQGECRAQWEQGLFHPNFRCDDVEYLIHFPQRSCIFCCQGNDCNAGPNIVPSNPLYS